MNDRCAMPVKPSARQTANGASCHQTVFSASVDFLRSRYVHLSSFDQMLTREAADKAEDIEAATTRRRHRRMKKNLQCGEDQTDTEIGFPLVRILFSSFVATSFHGITHSGAPMRKNNEERWQIFLPAR